MILALPWVLAACGGIGLETTLPDTGEDAAAVSVTSVTPAWGPPGGGTEVTIVGTGLEGAVRVGFGNAWADAVRVAADTILVASPEAGVEVTVDLTVESDLGSAVVPQGFAFRDDAPPDTGGSDTGSADTADTGGGGGDTDTGGGGTTGGVGGVVEFSYLVIACPECFGSTSQVEVSAAAAFHAPTVAGWVDWLPDVGGCTTTVAPTPPTSRFIDAGDWVYLEAGSRSVGLRATGSGSTTQYASSNLDNTDFVRNAAFDVRVTGGADLAAFTAVDAVRTPQGFDDLQPIGILGDATTAFSQRISKRAATFTWAPSGGDGSFVVLVQAYNPAGTTLLGSVLCRGRDNGTLTVPSTYLSSFPSGALLALTLSRYQIETFDLPGGAVGDSVATMGALGTGVLQ